MNNQNGSTPASMDRLASGTAMISKSIISDQIREYDGLLTETGDPQIICRNDGYVAGANSEACRLLGLTVEQTKNLSFCLWHCFTQASGQRLAELITRPGLASNQISNITLLTEGRINTTVDVQVLPIGGNFALITLCDTHQRWLEEIGR